MANSQVMCFPWAEQLPSKSSPSFTVFGWGCDLNPQDVLKKHLETHRVRETDDVFSAVPTDIQKFEQVTTKVCDWGILGANFHKKSIQISVQKIVPKSKLTVHGSSYNFIYFIIPQTPSPPKQSVKTSRFDGCTWIHFRRHTAALKGFQGPFFVSEWSGGLVQAMKMCGYSNYATGSTKTDKICYIKLWYLIEPRMSKFDLVPCHVMACVLPYEHQQFSLTTMARPFF